MTATEPPEVRHPDPTFLEATVGRITRSRAVHGAILCVASGDGSLAWRGAAGNLAPDARYFIASVTKMVVTVVVLQLRQEGRIDLDDPIRRHLPADRITGLHVTDGVDRTHEITVRHLISNTSGLTDYFFGKGPDGRRSADVLLAGQDEPWPLERVLERARTLRPRFAPGRPGKVHYSDTNYALLGGILERVTGQSRRLPGTGLPPPRAARHLRLHRPERHHPGTDAPPERHRAHAALHRLRDRRGRRRVDRRRHDGVPEGLLRGPLLPA